MFGKMQLEKAFTLQLTVSHGSMVSVAFKLLPALLSLGIKHYPLKLAFCEVKVM